MSEVNHFPRPMGDFWLVGLLGKGGMGVVYRANLQRAEGFVAQKALKVMSASTNPAGIDFTGLFSQEAKIGGSLSHPNIVATEDFTTVDGQRVIVMELVEGKTLREVLDDLRRISSVVPPTHITLEIGIQVCKGLAHAHADNRPGKRSVIHRDLKPSNLLVSHHGQVKIADFGLAHFSAEGGVSAPHMAAGTPSYMSPEQAAGAKLLTAATDIFSLGLILFQLTTGRPAYGASDKREVRDQAKQLGIDWPVVDFWEDDTRRELITFLRQKVLVRYDQRIKKATEFGSRLTNLLGDKSPQLENWFKDLQDKVRARQNSDTFLSDPEGGSIRRGPGQGGTSGKETGGTSSRRGEAEPTHVPQPSGFIEPSNGEPDGPIMVVDPTFRVYSLPSSSGGPTPEVDSEEDEPSGLTEIPAGASHSVQTPTPAPDDCSQQTELRRQVGSRSPPRARLAPLLLTVLVAPLLWSGVPAIAPEVIPNPTPSVTSEPPSTPTPEPSGGTPEPKTPDDPGPTPGPTDVPPPIISYGVLTLLGRGEGTYSYKRLTSPAGSRWHPIQTNIGLTLGVGTYYLRYQGGRKGQVQRRITLDTKGLQCFYDDEEDKINCK